MSGGWPRDIPAIWCSTARAGRALKERETQMKRNGAKSVSWKAGLVGGLFLALSPALAVAQQAQTPYATGILYEMREDINCNPGSSTAPNCVPPSPATSPADNSGGFGVRIADATLTGNIVSLTSFSGPVTLDASSILNQRDWTGPAHGKMTFADGVRATFSGQLNLSLAMFAGQPLAPISGKWQGTKGTLQAGGDFGGLFLIPVPLGCSSGVAPGCFYLELGPDGQPDGKFVPLMPNEYAPTPPGLGLVKLVVTFLTN